MDELSAVLREQARRVVADHAPVADRDELGAGGHAIDGEVLDDTGDVLGAARVLDVEENGAPAVRVRPLGGRRCDARRDRGLRRRQRHFGLVLDDLRGRR